MGLAIGLERQMSLLKQKDIFLSFQATQVLDLYLNQANASGSHGVIRHSEFLLLLLL